MRKKILKVRVLGTEYSVFLDDKNHDEKLTRCDGYIAPESKTITMDEANAPKHMEHVLTHELTHAFLYESGLDVETWANNEEIVDWIALQAAKISETAKQAKKTMKPLIQKKVKVIFDGGKKNGSPDGSQ